MGYIGIEPPGSGAYLVDTGEGDGSTATLTLSRPPVSVASILVIVQGSILPVESYSLDGVTLTFDTAPADGERIEVRHLGVALDIGTPTGATVNRAAIDTNALGPVVQVVTTISTSLVTITTTTPADDTSIPQSTEGDSIITRTITPKNTNNLIQVVFSAWGGVSTSALPVFSLYNASGNALRTWRLVEDTNWIQTLVHIYTAGGTSEQTLDLRAGIDTGTLYINGDNAGNIKYGASSIISLIATEYLVTS